LAQDEAKRLHDRKEIEMGDEERNEEQAVETPEVQAENKAEEQAEAPVEAAPEESAAPAEENAEAPSDGGRPTLESLDLKKPLEKMTAKELRDLCIEKMPEITGVSGMEKEEIVSNIKEFLGIEDEEEPENPNKILIRESKQKIRELKEKKAESASESRAQRNTIRKQINRLKKKTRRLADAG
jgi:3-oxoacyl-ACP reductase-like protein